MNLTQEQKDDLAAAATAALQALNPAIAGTVAAVAAVATQFIHLIHGIRNNDPNAWAEVRTDFTDSADGFEAAVAAHHAGAVAADPTDAAP